MQSTHKQLYISRDRRRLRFQLGDLPVGAVEETLAARLWELIQRGELKTGDMLPSDVEFAEHLQVNRDPVSRAITTLVEERHVQGRAGWGWFVA